MIKDNAQSASSVTFRGLEGWIPKLEDDAIFTAMKKNMEEYYAKMATPCFTIPIGYMLPSPAHSAVIINLGDETPPVKPAAPAVPRCSGCDQERDLGAKGKCWDCYVVVEKATTVAQMHLDASEAVKVDQIKRTTMQDNALAPMWQRNPNVGVWRLR